ncbi:MAG: tetratricopeptide repeat protein, partial [Firmicutes bacterium]|nr:tetratricopeptide repeat protein [Bacillota bacterium]
YSEAEPLYKQALAIVQKTLGPNHPNVAGILENMADFYRTTGREDEAKKLDEQAKAIRSMNR